MNLATAILVALGILIALSGIVVDLLWPDTTPGINLPQLFMIVTGLALSLGARQLRRQYIKSRLPGTVVTRIATLAAITVLTLLTLEIVLVLSGWTTYFPSELREVNVKVVPWWMCDDLGCRYQHDAAMDACDAGLITGRHCVVNRQGYSDSEDFVVGEDYAGRTRILVLGDSFTQGFSAEIGKSFVETFEAELPEAIVWNTAITGNGTSQALASFRAFAPLMKPSLSILGFYVNDFRDNLIPLGGALFLQDANGKQYKVRRFLYDRWGKQVDLRPEVMYHVSYLKNSYNPPTSELERITGLTRLGTLALRFLDILTGATLEQSLPRQKTDTRRYLKDLRDAAIEEGSDFLVLLIPAPARLEDVNKNDPTELYQTAIQLMQELEIPYLNPVDLIDQVVDYASPPDPHWSNDGHQKIGALLGDCIKDFIASDDLANCDSVIMP